MTLAPSTSLYNYVLDIVYRHSSISNLIKARLQAVRTASMSGSEKNAVYRFFPRATPDNLHERTHINNVD